MPRSRALLLGLLSTAVLGAGALAAARHPSVEPALVYADGLLWVETPDWAYSFDAVWRAESLHDLRVDAGRRENVIASRPAEAARYRGVLLRRMRLHRVEEIPREASEAVESLRRLGYVGK